MAIQSMHLGHDSDDENDDEDNDSADESGDDVYESDASSTCSYDDNVDPECDLAQEFNQLDISYDKHFLDHEDDCSNDTLIEPVDMDISSTEGLGSIDFDIPTSEQQDLVEGMTIKVLI